MIFIDNKYTRIYYAIINRAKTRITTGKTESHHIIPESFYLNRTRKGRKGWLEGNPEDPTNKVNLTLHEHFVCHLLLTKMVSTAEAQHKVDSAAAWLADCYISRNNGVRVTGRIYSKLRAASAQAQSNRRKGSKSNTAGKKSWISNGVTKFSVDCPGPDWKLGSIKKNKPSKLKGTTRPASVCAQISKSKIGKSGAVAGKLKWNNGSIVKYAMSSPGTEWVLGGLAKGGKFAVQKGKRHWNNGSISKMSFEKPGPDFVLGRLK
jgi:hypothetical protein